jgi:hypothetical protein
MVRKSAKCFIKNESLEACLHQINRPNTKIRPPDTTENSVFNVSADVVITKHHFRHQTLTLVNFSLWICFFALLEIINNFGLMVLFCLI